jgi:hypothetical protein
MMNGTAINTPESKMILPLEQLSLSTLVIANAGNQTATDRRSC